MKILKNTIDGKTRAKSLNCIENTNIYIHTNLMQNYNYGKEWTVYASLDPFVGRYQKNVVKFNIEPITFLIYFSNSPVRPVSMPLQDIENNLITRGINFFELFRFWNHLCPYPWEDMNKSAEKFYNKLELYNYCGSRSLCVVGTEKYIYSLKSNNTDLSFVAPCFGWPSIPVLMGLEEGQEMEYPPGDKFDKEDPFKWLNTLKKKIMKLRSKYKREIRKRKRAIKREIKSGFKEEKTAIHG